MIVKPLQQDQQQLYNLWKTIFAYADGGSINYFFSEIYNRDDFLVVKDVSNTEIIAGLYIDQKVLSLNGILFEVSVLDNLFTLYKYRNQGVMSDLLNKVLSELKNRHLFTLIKYSESIDFRKFGFETIYYNKRYLINRSDLFNVDGYSISTQFLIGEMYDVYSKFIKRFNGCLIRDDVMFEKYVQALRASGKEIFVTRDSERNICGYMVYDYIASELNVLEIIYLDSIALLTLLNQAMGLNAYIYVTVSSSENLERIIKDIKFETIEHMMIKINDEKLFKALFNVQNASINNVLKKSDKPLYVGYYWFMDTVSAYVIKRAWD